MGALPAETLPLLRWLRRPRPLSRRLIAGERAAVLTCGVGPERAERRTRDALERWPAAWVISLGTCGALIDGLAVGDVYCASALSVSGGPPLEVSPLAGLVGARVVTVDRPVFDAPRRAALAAEGAALVEMEAAGVAAAAAGRRFSAVKVVSDDAGASGGSTFTPTAVNILRFQRLALRLSRERLTPALVAALKG